MSLLVPAMSRGNYASLVLNYNPTARFQADMDKMRGKPSLYDQVGNNTKYVDAGAWNHPGRNAGSSSLPDFDPSNVGVGSGYSSSSGPLGTGILGAPVGNLANYNGNTGSYTGSTGLRSKASDNGPIGYTNREFTPSIAATGNTLGKNTGEGTTRNQTFKAKGSFKFKKGAVSEYEEPEKLTV